MGGAVLRIILDTGVLWRPRALEGALRLGARLVVPAVAFGERARQLQGQGVAVLQFLRSLARYGASVEPMGIAEASRYAPYIRDAASWHRLSRDAFIAGHVGRDDLLWTTNPRDFVAVGVPARQIVSIA